MENEFRSVERYPMEVPIPRVFAGGPSGRPCHTWSKNFDVEVAPTSESTLFVDIKAIVVRGVPYRGSLHLMRVDAGEFSESWIPYRDKAAASDYHALHLYRVDRFDNNDASQAARNTVRETLLSMVRDWILAHPDKMREGAAIDVNNNLFRNREKQNEVREQLRVLEAEEATLRAKLEALTGSRF